MTCYSTDRTRLKSGIKIQTHGEAEDVESMAELVFAKIYERWKKTDIVALSREIAPRCVSEKKHAPR